MPFWHFKYSCSSFVNWNIKSAGNLSIFLFTCRFICETSTWYSWAKSLSSITCFPLIVKILSSIFSLLSSIFMVVCVIMFVVRKKQNAIQVRLYLYRVVELFLPIYGIQTCLTKLYNSVVLSKPFAQPAALPVKSKYSTNNFKKIRIPQFSETRFGSFVGLFFVLMFISSSLAVRCQTTAWRLKVYGLTFIFRPQGPVQRFLLRVPLPSSSRFESGGR